MISKAAQMVLKFPTGEQKTTIEVQIELKISTVDQMTTTAMLTILKSSMAEQMTTRAEWETTLDGLKTLE